MSRGGGAGGLEIQSSGFGRAVRRAPGNRVPGPRRRRARLSGSHRSRPRAGVGANARRRRRCAVNPPSHFARARWAPMPYIRRCVVRSPFSLRFLYSRRVCSLLLYAFVYMSPFPFTSLRGKHRRRVSRSDRFPVSFALFGVYHGGPRTSLLLRSCRRCVVACAHSSVHAERIGHLKSEFRGRRSLKQHRV